MTSTATLRARSPKGAAAVLLALVALSGVVGAGCSSGSTPSNAATASDAYAGATGLTITPSPSNWAFNNGQTVAVSMGPNKVFTPGLRLNIIQCADPGGTEASLPTSFTVCDGNTIEANSVIPQKDGSFTEKDYTIFKLPNTSLGEPATATPVCNGANPCVLYVGEDQNDFSKPKVFSHPFVVTGSSSGPGS